MFSCPICEQTFTRKSNLTLHTNSQHVETEYPCLGCWRIFNRRATMIKHRKTHTENIMTPKTYTEAAMQISTARKNNMSDQKTHTENIVIPKTHTEAVSQIYTVHRDSIKKHSGRVLHRYTIRLSTNIKDYAVQLWNLYCNTSTQCVRCHSGDSLIS